MPRKTAEDKAWEKMPVTLEVDIPGELSDKIIDVSGGDNNEPYINILLELGVIHWKKNNYTRDLKEARKKLKAELNLINK